MPQERPARDYTLNKKRRIYKEENIIERVEHNDPQIVYSLLEIAQKYSEEKAEKEALPDLVFTIEPWQIEKDTMTGIYVQFSYGRYDTGIMRIPDFMLEQKVGGRYEVHFNYKDTFYFLSEDSSKQNKFVKGANLAQYLSGKSGSIPKRKNSAIQSVREMVTALNIISARQVNSDQAPKVLGKDFHDNFWLVQEVQKQLNEKLLSANERLKFNPNDQELLAKVKVLREEKNELEKEMKVFEKQLKTYDAALSILNEKGFTEFGDL